jgi:hypothetical protein
VVGGGQGVDAGPTNDAPERDAGADRKLA